MTWQPLVKGEAHRNGVPVDIGEATIWFNDLYVVHRTEFEPTREDNPDNLDRRPMIWLSIRNQDHGARHDWRDFQRIKNQLAGEDYEGVEIYPAESRKVDTANQYHLWCFPFQMPFGIWKERMVTNNDVTSLTEKGAVQRDNEGIDGPLNNLDEAQAWKDSHPGRATENEDEAKK